MSEEDKWMVKDANDWLVPCTLSWCESGAIRKFVKARFGGDSDIELWWEIFTENCGCRCVKVKIEEMSDEQTREVEHSQGREGRG